MSFGAHDLTVENVLAFAKMHGGAAYAISMDWLRLNEIVNIHEFKGDAGPGMRCGHPASFQIEKGFCAVCEAVKKERQECVREALHIGKQWFPCLHLPTTEQISQKIADRIRGRDKPEAEGARDLAAIFMDRFKNNETDGMDIRVLLRLFLEWVDAGDFE